MQFSNAPAIFALSWVKLQIKILDTHIIVEQLVQRNFTSKRCPQT
jgi:hypothetical protein